MTPIEQAYNKVERHRVAVSISIPDHPTNHERVTMRVAKRNRVFKATYWYVEWLNENQ